jgi:hypothetical protein
MMEIRDHGFWIKYIPATAREGAPTGTMFALRVEDDTDWYDYVNPGTNFLPDSVKFAAIQREGIGYVVGPAVYDATRIFPAEHIVCEILGYTGNDPQADFGNKVYDPSAGSFNNLPPPLPPPPSDTETQILSALSSIMERLDKLERKKK